MSDDDTGDKITFTFECQKCGGTVLSLPDDHTDDSIAECKACGQPFGRWGDIQTKARDMAAERVRDLVRDKFKGLKGWTIK